MRKHALYLKETEITIKALSNKRRLLIVRFLRGKRSAPVGEIATSIKLSFKATSKHLSILYSAGIVEKEQVSLQMLYRLSPEMSHVAKYISNSLE